MNSFFYFTLFMLILFSLGARTQTLEQPISKVESYFFSDSTLVELTNPNAEGEIVVEIGQGNNTFFREYTGPFYVDQTKTISCKITHPDYNDSRLTTLKLYRLTDTELKMSDSYKRLLDREKGSARIDSSQWMVYDEEKVEFKLICTDRKLEEIELLSYVSTGRNILPPKKVVLHAHLKNGKVVHVRTANTVGSFKKVEQNWSHVVRLSGKPKLRKILRKTEFFTLTVYAKKKNEEPVPMAFDEILVR